ncbi:hypothetical protein [Brevundimonas sp.]|uniref:hypothetical protein n=1 Tax=Brevundimonas sp. TaxID=1871086 RepID=UPI002D4404EA|nr:hypothetical protein [Brevundimonas sp.]HYC98629.1 hypothetical protein [Brevundimonas sp.]
MTFASIFGDDEHTAADDPYARVLKARKWVLLAAGLVWLFGAGYFEAKPFGVLLGTANIPGWVWFQASLSAIAYSGLQYMLLIAQLGSRYRRILDGRVNDHLHERADRLFGEMDTVADEIETLTARRSSNSAILDPEALETRLRAATRRRKLLDVRIQALRDDMQHPKWYVALEGIIDLIRIGAPILAAALAIILVSRAS